jgi:hypothetical protein
MLIAAIAIWLILLLLAVAFCRAAATADGRDTELSARYPSRSTTGHLAGAPPAARVLSPGDSVHGGAAASGGGRSSRGKSHALGV